MCGSAQSQPSPVRKRHGNTSILETCQVNCMIVIVFSQSCTLSSQLSHRTLAPQMHLVPPATQPPSKNEKQSGSLAESSPVLTPLARYAVFGHNPHPALFCSVHPLHPCDPRWAQHRLPDGCLYHQGNPCTISSSSSSSSCCCCIHLVSQKLTAFRFTA